MNIKDFKPFDKPRRYPFWCQSARDIYDERIAIARADLRLDDKDQTPPHIEALAVRLAEGEQSLVDMTLPLQIS